MKYLVCDPALFMEGKAVYVLADDLSGKGYKVAVPGSDIYDAPPSEDSNAILIRAFDAAAGAAEPIVLLKREGDQYEIGKCETAKQFFRTLALPEGVTGEQIRQAIIDNFSNRPKAPKNISSYNFH